MNVRRYPLINAETLKKYQDDAAWVIIDCRFDLMDNSKGKELYEQRHIPGARYADLNNDLAGNPGSMDGRHPLPDISSFSQTLSKLGVSNVTNVVVYDDVGGAIAARLWWMLRWARHESVYILDGGIQAWERKGYLLEKGHVAFEPASFFISSVRNEWVIETEGICNALKEGAVLLDARSEERFLGRSEPIDPVAGHIPGAINLPFTLAIDSLGKLKKAEDLRKILTSYFEDTKEVIGMCGSGVTACHLALTAKLAGFGDIKVYIGSWSQWILSKNSSV
ncbi:MAG: sulfurtransferase [Gammaproteobacteria bacterium]|nr:sulfurtransferase [Gammaproteobacteria bacterium]